ARHGQAVHQLLNEDLHAACPGPERERNPGWPSCAWEGREQHRERAAGTNQAGGTRVESRLARWRSIPPVPDERPAQPPESPGGGAGGGSSTAQVNLSEVPGATMQTSVAKVTWWCLLKTSGTGETTPLYLVFRSWATTASGSSTVPTSCSAWA